MPWKFEDNRWWYQLDFERFTTNINGKLKQVSLKNLFNKIKGSWIEEIDFWTTKWNQYFRYYNATRSEKFTEYLNSDDYKKFIKCRDDFRRDLYFNEKLISDAEKHGKYEVNKQSYESIKYIVEHLNWYKSPWFPLNPSYKKPIHKSENKFKNIKPRRLVEVQNFWPSRFIKKVYPTDLFRKDKHYYYEPVYETHFRYLD